MQNLMVKSGSRYRKATVAEVSEVAGLYALEAMNRQRPSLSSPSAARGFLQQMYAGLDYEVFSVLFLDKRHRLIKCEEMFRGTIDGASVHPREIVKECLWSGAAAVIIAHNHPSGIAEPSHADELVTQRLKDALGLIDVRLIDHLIVAGYNICSLAERGLI